MPVEKPAKLACVPIRDAEFFRCRGRAVIVRGDRVRDIQPVYR